MRLFRHHIFNVITNLCLALAVASSFFIIPGIHIGTTPIPQPFYFLSFIALAGIAIKFLLYDSRPFLKQIFFWAKILAVLAVFFGVNAVFYFSATGSFIVPYGKDLARTFILLLILVAILVNTALDRSSFPWLMGALFIPLVLVPALLLRDIDAARTMFSWYFFSGYSLQGMQYNPSSLAAWLIVPFGLLSPIVLDPLAKRWLRIISAATATALMSLIWWTNSRGAIFAAILILIGTAVVYRRKHVALLPILRGIALIAIVVAGGFLLLPPQAKTGVFVRFYPQYFQTALQKNFYVPIKQAAPKVLVSPPNLVYAQQRQTFWPEYGLFVLAHPFGQYGPALPIMDKDFVYKGAEHNSALQAGVWGGWGAFFVFIYFLYEVFKTSVLSIMNGPKNPRHAAVGLGMAFLGVCILIMLNSFLQEKTIWILAALIAAYPIYEATREANNSS